MLMLALWGISISTASSLNYVDLVADIENTLDDCMSVVDDARNYVAELDALGNVRRRDEEEDSDHAVQLWACVSMLKAMDQYRENHSRLLLAHEFVSFQEKTYLNQLLAPVSKKIGQIPLYVASRDGDRGIDFHEKCDGKGPTVTIIKSTTGYVFGGYTDVSWSCCTADWHSSTTSFLFQLRPNFAQYTLKSGQEPYAVRHSEDDLIFGNGGDIFVRSGALNNSDSGVGPGRSYNVEWGVYTLNGGEVNFMVQDYFVFEAIAL